ncbi:MAG: hypothetical protein EZS28_045042 [Streblomastix strix]|uniref:HTH cro/C1-type domain-containing protein n=1 Tax=Streblomastix strix TaxID=222440 RepID=A0A5J4TPT7_9EUKA|nr:MAG: hypothetical protein EZS28_045042 [Streblomastix strix]
MEARNLTNEKLAQSSGVNVSVLINLSIGNRDLNIKYAEALAPSLGVSVRYLMEEKPDPKMLLLENLENIRKDGNSIFPGVDLSSTRLSFPFV